MLDLAVAIISLFAVNSLFLVQNTKYFYICVIVASASNGWLVGTILASVLL